MKNWTARCQHCSAEYAVYKPEYPGEYDIYQGECSVCRNELCRQCHGICPSCGKGLCEKCAQQHPYAVHNGKPQRWCPECIALDESLAEEAVA